MRMYGFGPRHTLQMNGKSSPMRSPSGVLASVVPGLAAASAIMSADDRRESCTGGLINWLSPMAVEAAAAHRGTARRTRRGPEDLARRRPSQTRAPRMENLADASLGRSLSEIQ
eukprot:scaffold16003_cov57-Phaeocystis_antarctica.AAC.1